LRPLLHVSDELDGAIWIALSKHGAGEIARDIVSAGTQSHRTPKRALRRRCITRRQLRPRKRDSQSSIPRGFGQHIVKNPFGTGWITGLKVCLRFAERKFRIVPRAARGHGEHENDYQR
jgi:hypothetical protein